MINDSRLFGNDIVKVSMYRNFTETFFLIATLEDGINTFNSTVRSDVAVGAASQCSAITVTRHWSMRRVNASSQS